LPTLVTSQWTVDTVVDSGISAGQRVVVDYPRNMAYD